MLKTGTNINKKLLKNIFKNINIYFFLKFKKNRQYFKKNIKKIFKKNIQKIKEKYKKK